MTSDGLETITQNQITNEIILQENVNQSTTSGELVSRNRQDATINFNSIRNIDSNQQAGNEDYELGTSTDEESKKYVDVNLSTNLFYTISRYYFN
jgi:hypothetical protein